MSDNDAKPATYSHEYLANLDARHLVHPCGSPKGASHNPFIFESGHGVWLRDIDGNEYIDAYGAMGTMIAGYGRSDIAEVMASQATTLAFSHCFYGYSTPPAILLAGRIASLAPAGLTHVFFTSGGSESNESAIKAARLYHSARGNAGKYKIISRRLAYHGLTLGTLPATGMPAFHRGFGPEDPNYVLVDPPYCYRCPVGKRHPECELACAQQVEDAIIREGPESVAAFIGEPMIGSGGYIVPAPGYLQRIREICDTYDVLMIDDEVLAGFGRTGRMFAIEHWGIVPDIITSAKALTSGYAPLGAVILSDRVYSTMNGERGVSYAHGFTYSGHTTCCAVGLKTLDIIRDEYLEERAASMGARLLAGLRSIVDDGLAGDARGIGLLAGLELTHADDSSRSNEQPGALGSQVVEAALRHGVIVRNAGDIIGLRPPLVINEDEVDRVVAALRDSIKEVKGQV